MKRILCLISLLLAVSLLSACTPAMDGGGTLVTDHNWKFSGDWVVTQTDTGAQAITIDASAEATAWYESPLSGNWILSTELKLLKATGDTDCARVVFRDKAGNPCLTVTTEYVGTAHVQMRVDAFTNAGEPGNIGGWHNLYISDGWSQINPENNLFLIVCRTGKDTFTIQLSQYGTDVIGETAITLDQRYLDLACQAGVATYGSHVRFTGFAVQ